MYIIILFNFFYLLFFDINFFILCCFHRKGKTMKIIKYSLVLALGAFLLPAPPQDQILTTSTGGKINLETGEVLSAAASTFGDVSNFCYRQPAVCNTAGNVMGSLEARAKYNFKLLYEWASGTPQQQGTIPALPVNIDQSARVERITTGSIIVKVAGNSGKKSENTLQIEDLVPEWRGPTRSRTG